MYDLIVIGGGPAGITAAVTAINRRLETLIISERWGGQTAYFMELEDADIHQVITGEELLSRFRHQLDYLDFCRHYDRVVQVSPEEGHFSVTTIDNDQFRARSLIIATGAKPATTAEYLYGQSDRVMTQKELEKKLTTEGPDPSWKNVVMIQCVGSRDETHPWCSRVCCSHAVKNALRLKELAPETNVYVLYRDVRTYGFMELAYQQVRDAGVAFLRYELPEKPQVTVEGDGLRVVTSEPIIRQQVVLQADLLVLSTGIEPRDNARLAELLNLPLDEDGFYQEDHPKMRPMDFTRAGLFLAGLAHSPRHIYESIAQANGAAARAAALLARQEIVAQTTRVTVNPRLCSFCGLCVKACPYEARVMDYEERVAQVMTDLCQGCGVCAMVCPNKATQQYGFSHKQMLATIDAAFG